MVAKFACSCTSHTQNVQKQRLWDGLIKNDHPFLLAHLMILWTSCQQNQAIQEHRPSVCKKGLICLNINFSDDDITNDAVSHHTPLEYFWRFVALTDNTNEYSFKKKEAVIKSLWDYGNWTWLWTELHIVNTSKWFQFNISFNNKYNIHKNMTCLIIIIVWSFVYGYISCCLPCKWTLRSSLDLFGKLVK